MEEQKEDVSYDVKSLLTNFSVKEPTDQVIDQIYIQKKSKAICTKLVFNPIKTGLFKDNFLGDGVSI